MFSGRVKTSSPRNYSKSVPVSQHDQQPCGRNRCPHWESTQQIWAKKLDFGNIVIQMFLSVEAAQKHALWRKELPRKRPRRRRQPPPLLDAISRRFEIQKNSILTAKFRKITYLHLRMHAGAGLSQFLIIMYYTVFVKFSETRKLVVGSRKQEMGHKLIIAKQ